MIQLKKVEKEQALLDNQHEHWKGLYERNAPMYELIEQVRLTEYIVKAQRMVCTESISFSIGKKSL